MSEAVARTKADPNRSRREDQLVAEIERLEAVVSGLQAPGELWLRRSAMGHWFGSHLAPPESDAVRYVRADLYDKRMAEPVNQEPLGELGTDYPR